MCEQRAVGIRDNTIVNKTLRTCANEDSAKLVLLEKTARGTKREPANTFFSASLVVQRRRRKGHPSILGVRFVVSIVEAVVVVIGSAPLFLMMLLRLLFQLTLAHQIFLFVLLMLLFGFFRELFFYLELP